MKRSLRFESMLLAVATLGIPKLAFAEDDTVVVQPPAQQQPQAQPPPQKVEIEVEDDDEDQQMQPAARPTYPPPGPEGERVETTGGPSRGMLFTGIAVFGISYGAAAVVSGTSDLEADDRLIVPVVGPWLSLGDRPDCGGLDEASCDEENTNRVLLVVDGVFQAVGAGLIVGAFLNPEKRTTATARMEPPKRRLHIGPTTSRSGFGVAAFGTF